MPIELKVPEVGESITEVMIGAWKKAEGDAVAVDDAIVEIESDKATVELPAPVAGSITKILKGSGERAVVGEVIGWLEPAGAGASTASPAPVPAPVSAAPAAPQAGGSAPAAARVMPAAAPDGGPSGFALAPMAWAMSCSLGLSLPISSTAPTLGLSPKPMSERLWAWASAPSRPPPKGMVTHLARGSAAATRRAVGPVSPAMESTSSSLRAPTEPSARR